MTEKRIRGDKLQRIRREMYADNPYCSECGKLLIKGEEYHVDHIIPLYKGGKEDHDNRQLLCVPCHADKTRQDNGWKVAREVGVDGWPVE